MKRKLLRTLINWRTRPKVKRLYHEGQVYNLREIYHEINREYFEEKLDLKITWFGSGITGRTSVLFGSYTYAYKLIKINRVLDREDVPKDFVRYIVYHEMLHNIHPPKRGKRGRRAIHHAEFKEKERKFREFDFAKNYLKSWKKQHFRIG